MIHLELHSIHGIVLSPEARVADLATELILQAGMDVERVVVERPPGATTRVVLTADDSVVKPLEIHSVQPPLSQLEVEHRVSDWLASFRGVVASNRAQQRVEVLLLRCSRLITDNDALRDYAKRLKRANSNLRSENHRLTTQIDDLLAAIDALEGTVAALRATGRLSRHSALRKSLVGLVMFVAASAQVTGYSLRDIFESDQAQLPQAPSSEEVDLAAIADLVRFCRAEVIPVLSEIPPTE